MELWIRSQDRLRLCKANNLFIKNLSICCSCNDENNDYDYLGVYSTKERALEVLDEIQRLITDLQYMSYTVDSSSFYSYRPNVYEMPKE